MSDGEIEDTFLSGLERMYPGFSRTDVACFRVSRVREVFAIPTLGYSTRVPPIATSVPGVHLVTSAQIVNGTLNVNETVRLAESAARDTAQRTRRLASLNAVGGVRPPSRGRAVRPPAARHALARPRQSVVVPEDPRRRLMAVLSVVPRPRRPSRAAIPRRARPADHLVRGGSGRRNGEEPHPAVFHRARRSRDREPLLPARAMAAPLPAGASGRGAAAWRNEPSKKRPGITPRDSEGPASACPKTCCSHSSGAAIDMTPRRCRRSSVRWRGRSTSATPSSRPRNAPSARRCSGPFREGTRPLKPYRVASERSRPDRGAGHHDARVADADPHELPRCFWASARRRWPAATWRSRCGCADGRGSPRRFCCTPTTSSEPTMCRPCRFFQASACLARRRGVSSSSVSTCSVATSTSSRLARYVDGLDTLPQRRAAVLPTTPAGSRPLPSVAACSGEDI